MENYKDKNGEEITTGVHVIVPDPIDSDIHNHSFVGYVTDIVDGVGIIEDGDSDFFEIEVHRLELCKD